MIYCDAGWQVGSPTAIATWSPRFEALGDFTEAPQQHLSGPVVQIVNIGSVRFGPLSKITQ